MSAIDRAGAAIGSILAVAGKRKHAKANAANQFAYDLDKGAYENDTFLLNEHAKDVTTSAKNELRNDGKISIDTERKMKDGLAAQQMSNNQMKRAQALQADINSKKDPYYNPEPDINLVKWATHGDNNDVDYRSRGERLSQAEKQLGGTDTFKYDLYRADYVKRIGAQSKDLEFPLKSGGTKTIFDQATFWDDSGKPGVTDQHAIRYLESDKRVNDYFDTKVNKELDSEIKSMKSSGDNRVSWMKGMSDIDIKNELINDPLKNIINNQDYGVRVRDKAKSDLEEADRINSKVSYTGLQNDNNNSGGRWKNPNILHDNAINSFAQQARSVDTGQAAAATTHGPGGVFTQKSGRPIQVDTSNPIRTDINRGITTRDNKGSMRMNLTGYQLMPIKAGSGPFVLKSPTTDGMVQEIQQIPLDYFDPNGKVKLQPEMKIGLNGYTINEAGVLNDIQDQLFDLSTQLNEATKIGDKEKIGNIQNMEYNLNGLKEMIGSGNYDAQDLLMAGNKAGVRKIKQDWIVPAGPSDVSTIKNITGGFNLNDKSYWSDDMKIVEDAYRKRAEEAKAQNYGQQKPVNTKSKVTLKPSYSAGGKSYSLDALKKMGYTDDQIAEAVKLGNLK